MQLKMYIIYNDMIHYHYQFCKGMIRIDINEIPFGKLPPLWIF